LGGSHGLRIQELPGRRALKNANKGHADGDAGRVFGTEKKYPNLVMIPESIINVHIVAFTKNLDIALDQGWKSLTPYHVGIIRGHQYSEKMVTFYKSITKADNTEQLLTLLEKERAELVITVQIEGLATIKKANLKNIKVMQPPLETIPIYTYLHKKHLGLVAKLNKAIISMKGDGTYREIQGRVLSPYMENFKHD
jgi:polar amino acid transport system substrate-binding protein